MQTFTFRHNNGDLTTVQAGSEKEARHLAMVDRYGPPSGMYGVPTKDGLRYQGLGLSLQ